MAKKRKPRSKRKPRTSLPNDTISRVLREIAAILSEPQNRERIARRIETSEP